MRMRIYRKEEAGPYAKVSYIPYSKVILLLRIALI
jgi:hypothetical protein